MDNGSFFSPFFCSHILHFHSHNLVLLFCSPVSMTDVETSSVVPPMHDSKNTPNNSKTLYLWIFFVLNMGCECLFLDSMLPYSIPPGTGETVLEKNGIQSSLWWELSFGWKRGEKCCVKAECETKWTFKLNIFSVWMWTKVLLMPQICKAEFWQERNKLCIVTLFEPTSLSTCVLQAITDPSSKLNISIHQNLG